MSEAASLIVVLVASPAAAALLATRKAIKRWGAGGRSALAPMGILDSVIGLALLILVSGVANVAAAAWALGHGR